LIDVTESVGYALHAGQKHRPPCERKTLDPGRARKGLVLANSLAGPIPRPSAPDSHAARKLGHLIHGPAPANERTEYLATHLIRAPQAPSSSP
jgi:hypothetical protein